MEQRRPWSRPGEYAYGIALFTAALIAVALSFPGSSLDAGDWPVVLFFLGFGLFTIAIGYEHSAFGYVSFDRVAQVSSLLVLGPVDAAWINGLASLIYPWHRLGKGQPLRAVLFASLTNSGLMALMVLAAGHLYLAAGGAVPLDGLGLASFGAVLLTLLAMQLINEAGMMGLYFLRGQSPRQAFSLFDTTMELAAGLVAIVVAITWTRMETGVLVLLLAVLAAGMLALKRFAEMRMRLERLVADRTAALQEKTRQLERLAAQDTLTGLYNRRHADDHLRGELDRALRDGVAFSVALADIDHFKQINDRHSHGVGDRVLERVARVFESRIGSAGMVARYGGEEFLFCFPGLDEDAARIVCEELRLAVASEDWSTLSPGLGVTMSVGVAARRREVQVPALIERADTCLYLAKRSGRNRVIADSHDGMEAGTPQEAEAP
ncbi:MAG: GGDEF domain-containing protein [Steroidobacteraceae bacterium]|jgi:diguanylate cyclase (GGDEF)-like protein|nr:GGDEF domain-containing protein [Steroidobacteraceae bacterium]